jgi:hypothetical protein
MRRKSSREVRGREEAKKRSATLKEKAVGAGWEVRRRSA